MRSYCAIYVDVGYLLAAAATRVTGTSLRRGVDVDHPELIKALIEKAEEDSGLPLLRVNWYDSGARPGGMPDFVQDEIGLLPRVKLRLGRLSHAGEQKGVDLRIGLDLATHGRNRVVDVIYLVSGDDDLTEAVEEAQGHGVQLILLAVPGQDGRPHGVARHLQRAADGLVLLDGDTIDQVVRSRAIPEPLVPNEFKVEGEIVDGQVGADGARAGTEPQTAGVAADPLVASQDALAAASKNGVQTGASARTAGDGGLGDASSDGAVSEDRSSAGGGAESAVPEGAVAEGAVTTGAVAEGAVSKGAVAEGAVSTGVPREGAEGTVAERASEDAEGTVGPQAPTGAGAAEPDKEDASPAPEPIPATAARNGAPAQGGDAQALLDERRRRTDSRPNDIGREDIGREDIRREDIDREPVPTGGGADQPPGPSPSLFAKRKATTLVPPPEPVWTTETGAEPSGSFVGASPELIDIVARQVVRSWCATATPEDLALLKRQRPSIPPDLDRALLMDLSNRSDQYDIDEVSRHDLRNRFWQLLDQVKLT